MKHPLLSADQAERLVQAWHSGSTVAALQKLSGVSRLTVVEALKSQGIEPGNWRTRNRTIGRPVGPVSGAKSKSEAICQTYVAGKSLMAVSSAFSLSRSTVRRVLVDAGVVLLGRGRPAKPARVDF